MSQLLLEFFSEEIPARMQKGAQETLATLFRQKIIQQGIDSESLEIKTYVTPRRLVLCVENLPTQQQDQEEERRGPRVDAPDAALQGFLTSTSLALADCDIRETPKGKFYFAVIRKKGKALKDLWPDLVRDLIADFTWPKSMRWAGSQQTWVRPLHSGLCLFDGEAVHFDVIMGDESEPNVPTVHFGDTTMGHRFLNPTPFKVENFDQYQETLRACHVILDPKERRQIILEQAEKLAEKEGCRLLEDERLLEELVGLVEWPVLHLGQIDRQFLGLPREVLITSMRVHQRYLVLEHPHDGLSHFIIVANSIAPDGGRTTIEGNQRVLKARLSDADFFMSQDRRKTLKQHADQLHQLVFHQDLGTLAQKTQRLQQLAQYLAPAFGLDPKIAGETAALLKSDLVTEMVGEFPELQGIIGQYYARAEGYDLEVATAIGQQYFLKSQAEHGSLLTSLGRLMALVDRFDTLISFFSIGIKPTGSKDPYALRRAALTMVDLLDDQNITLDFDSMVAQIHGALKDIASEDKYLPLAHVQQQFKEFFDERLKIYWQKQGLDHDIIAASMSNHALSSLYNLKQKCRDLQNYFKGENSQGFLWLQGYRRALHILKIEEHKDQKVYQGSDVDPALFQEPEEQAFFSALQQFDLSHQGSSHNKNFHDLLKSLSTLIPAIDAYFDKIMINAEDTRVRQNRLNTLAFFRRLVDQMADFSKIED
ncbi:MAG: glycine--tRNA ligase subunit beta [Janthinobacterium lividum]